MSRLHLGINNCFAVKRWPEPEQWLSIVKNDLGLDCCQFSLDLVDPLLDQVALSAYATDVRKLAEQFNVLIHSTFTGLAAYSWSQLLHPQEAMRNAAMRWYEQAISFTAQLGAWGTGGHIGAFSVQDAADPTRRDALTMELYDRLNLLARSAAKAGLQFFMFENMAVAREFGHSIEEAMALAAFSAENGVPFVLCLDVGHPCALHTGTKSDDYLAWFAQEWPYPPIVHLQQTDHSGDHHWPFTGKYNREGMIKAESVLTAIKQWSTAGDIHLFLEPIHPFEENDQQVLQDLRESVLYWKEAMSNIDLE
jgi:sugar phosphate isomerase/epimerase